MLEVCVDSFESALNAIHGGADELEVCSSLPEGGLTPTAGLVREIIKMVNNVPLKKFIYKKCNDCNCKNLIKKPKVNVMIRCRAGSDFFYSKEEMDTMLADIEIFKTMGVDRFVFGVLTSAQDIDEEICNQIISSAHPIPVTFHRAFDICKEPRKTLNKLINLGFSRVLTSGQKPSANDPEAIILIKTLVEEFGNKIEIMPGAGINQHNAKTFIDIGCNIVHGSCKRVKELPKLENNINMGTSSEEVFYVTSEAIVKQLKDGLK